LELLFKWGIPYFYYKKKPFCYLAPNHKKGFVDAGFARGFQLKRNQDCLVDEKRNTVKSLRYYDLKEIDNAILEDVIREAATLYKKISQRRFFTLKIYGYYSLKIPPKETIVSTKKKCCEALSELLTVV
jgi:hypothetical protein